MGYLETVGLFEIQIPNGIQHHTIFSASVMADIAVLDKAFRNRLQSGREFFLDDLKKRFAWEIAFCKFIE